MYNSCCAHDSSKIELDEKAELSVGKRLRKLINLTKKAFDKAAEQLHRTGGFAYEDKPVKELHKALNATLQDAVNTGITHEVPAPMLNKLKQDVFVFSGMKTYAELKELSGLLTDADGSVKGWPKFLQDATKLNKVHNENHLEAEYQQAVGTSQAMDKYLEFEKEGDAYDLQIRTAQDNKVRDSHAAMHNITLPFSHPFWNTHWTPFGWRCRCNIVQVRKGKYDITDTDAATAAGQSAVPEMFRYNPAKAKVIFPPKHPYYAQHCGKKLNVSGNIEQARVVLSNERNKCEWQKRLKDDFEKQKSERKAKDSELKQWASHNITKGGDFIEMDNIKSGRVKITRSSIDNISNHIMNVQDKNIVKDIKTIMPELSFLKSAQIKGDKKSIGKKIARGVLSYNYYRGNWNNRSIVINMEVMSGGYEQAYAIILDKKNAPDK